MRRGLKKERQAKNTERQEERSWKKGFCCFKGTNMLGTQAGEDSEGSACAGRKLGECEM